MYLDLDVAGLFKHTMQSNGHKYKTQISFGLHKNASCRDRTPTTQRHTKRRGDGLNHYIIRAISLYPLKFIIMIFLVCFMLLKINIKYMWNKGFPHIL